MQNYIQLIELSPEELQKLSKEADQLFHDTIDYFDLYKHDLAPTQAEISKEVKVNFYEEYLIYNKGLWQRTKDILFLSGERITRRKKANSTLPPSTEFQQILQLIEDTLNLFAHHNQELQKKIAGEPYDTVEEPHIWRKLDVILDQWYNNFPNNTYYHHALIEVALITYKIRWAAKETSRLLASSKLN